MFSIQINKQSKSKKAKKKKIQKKIQKNLDFEFLFFQIWDFYSFSDFVLGLHFQTTKGCHPVHLILGSGERASGRGSNDGRRPENPWEGSIDLGTGWREDASNGGGSPPPGDGGGVENQLHSRYPRSTPGPTSMDPTQDSQAPRHSIQPDPRCPELGMWWTRLFLTFRRRTNPSKNCQRANVRSRQNQPSPDENPSEDQPTQNQRTWHPKTAPEKKVKKDIKDINDKKKDKKNMQKKKIITAKAKSVKKTKKN